MVVQDYSMMTSGELGQLTITVRYMYFYIDMYWAMDYTRASYLYYTYYFTNNTNNYNINYSGFL